METTKKAEPHTVRIDNRELVTLTGITLVESFNEYEITLATETGMLRIEGDNLHITKLNLDDGQAVVSGDIVAMEYSDYVEQKHSLFSKMFK